ncbi:uncharacterized protein LOC111069045 [Drosophila obscura]|uniref:uncharacterized protein LOC111069045 n=1 Tax=Drosophila obscura TaxID=7282 RepID=UPI001BB2CDB9|nr:uncharacterized protein LOC111069045 [Drosophila obscura]
MSSQKQTKAPGQTPAQGQEPDKRTADEVARRHRAQLRFTYGNMISNANLNRMRTKLNASATDAGPTHAAVVQGGGEAAAKRASGVSSEGAANQSLRRISSTFEYVRNVRAGCCEALPHEDNDADGREERAEVLICSQMMPQAPATVTAKSVEKEKDKEEPQLDGWDSCYARPPGSSRAVERWQQLSSTVTNLFSARHFANSPESPVAKTRRLREQREMLQIFTRPFLVDQHKRE